MTETLELLEKRIFDYIINLDWNFMISFIMISYIVTKDEMISWWKKFMSEPNTFQKVLNSVRYFLLIVPKIWRVIIIGIFYGTIFAWYFNYDKVQIGNLVNSIIFSIVFHKMLIARFEKQIDKVLKKKTNE